LNALTAKAEMAAEAKKEEAEAKKEEAPAAPKAPPAPVD
jgi:hypothetical protein